MNRKYNLLRHLKRSICDYAPQSAKAVHLIYRQWAGHVTTDLMYAADDGSWHSIDTDTETDFPMLFDLFRPLGELATDMSLNRTDPIELTITCDPASIRTVAICRRYNRKIVKFTDHDIANWVRKWRTVPIKLFREEEPDWDNPAPFRTTSYLISREPPLLKRSKRAVMELRAASKKT